MVTCMATIFPFAAPTGKPEYCTMKLWLPSCLSKLGTWGTVLAKLRHRSDHVIWYDITLPACWIVAVSPVKADGLFTCEVYHLIPTIYNLYSIYALINIDLTNWLFTYSIMVDPWTAEFLSQVLFNCICFNVLLCYFTCLILIFNCIPKWGWQLGPHPTSQEHRLQDW